MPLVSRVNQASTDAIHAQAYNADRSELALSTSASHALQLFRSTGPGGQWEKTADLAGHEGRITSLDWAPRSNRIVTCSHDRNAYVWNYDPSNQTWTPTLVLLRLSRAATVVRWSPDESKFAVGSAATAVAVCSFEPAEDWWVAKHLKKPFRSSVVALDWHPNSVLLATGSIDGEAHVLSTFLKGHDSKPAPTVWGEKLPFNTIVGTFANVTRAPVRAVAFSPSGNVLAYAAHDATVTLIYPAGPEQPPQAQITLRLPALPATSLLFPGADDDHLVVAGHDCQPYALSCVSGAWKVERTLDTGSASASSAGGQTSSGRLAGSMAFNRFHSADTHAHGDLDQPSAETKELGTVHQNTITSLYLVGKDRVSSTGADGQIVLWNANEGQPVQSISVLSKKLGGMTV